MPESVAQEISSSGVTPELLKSPSAALTMVHVFVTERHDLSRQLNLVRELLEPSGMIWVSWPKKTAKVKTDVTDEVIRAEAFPLGLVDIKICSVDEIWSGLKLVIRKAARKKT